MTKLYILLLSLLPRRQLRMCRHSDDKALIESNATTERSIELLTCSEQRAGGAVVCLPHVTTSKGTLPIWYAVQQQTSYLIIS